MSLPKLVIEQACKDLNELMDYACFSPVEALQLRAMLKLIKANGGNKDLFFKWCEFTQTLDRHRGESVSDVIPQWSTFEGQWA